MRCEFFHSLNNSEKEYANCNRFDSPSSEGGVQVVERLLNSVKEKIAALLGKDLNPVAVARIVNVILDAYQNSDPRIPIECFTIRMMRPP